MRPVRLQLFGTPMLMDAGVRMPLAPERLTQLAIVLAARGDWVLREHLIALLWPELSEESARRNLRKLLFRARRQHWFDGLQTRVDALRWSVESDLRDFETACSRRDWSGAVREYRGTFCDGYEHKAAEPFVEWLRLERNRLAAAYRAAAAQRLTELAADPSARAALAGQWLTLDPLDEDALAAMVDALRAQARAGDAQRAIEEFRRRLATELGVEPSARVRALAPDAAPAAPATGDPSAAGFVGRGVELSEVQALLARGECRVLTVTGPGGVGKSRLVKQALPRLAVDFTDGVRWIALDDLADAAQAVARIAGELDVPQDREPLHALCARLKSCRLLLVLDNCEHLRELPRLIERLLAEAAGLKICATSRTRLGASGEWLLPLGGLPVPAAGAAAADVLGFDSTRLFVVAARAAKPDFDAAAHGPSIAALVRAVGGLPLAILLAAHWTRLLPVGEIVAEVERSLDVLETEEEGEERPEHRSVRATFAQSWRLLTPAEQSTLAALSAFAGPFSRAAARHVADASLPLLAALADKSLLQIDGARCALHPLIRQFAAERLPNEVAGAARRHAEYFCSELAKLATYVRADEDTVVAGIGAQLPDALLAVNWARANARFDLLDGATWTLAHFFFLTGRAAEGLDALGPVPALSPAPGRLAARVGSQHGDGVARLLYQLGRYEDAGRSAKLAFRYARLAGDRDAGRVVLSILATVAARLGQLDQSRRYSWQTLRLSEQAGDAVGVATSLLNLGKVETDLGRWDDAEARFVRALELNRASGNQLGVIAALNNLATLHIDAGRPQRALAPLAEGLDQIDASNLSGLRSGFLANLARAHMDLGARDEARLAAAAVVGIGRSAAEPGNVTDCLIVLARVALEEGDLASARGRLGEAARLAAEGVPLRSQMRCLLAGAEVLAATGRESAAAGVAARIAACALASHAERIAAGAYTSTLSDTARAVQQDFTPADALNDLAADIGAD